MFEKTSEEAFHMKGIMKQLAVLCLDLIIRISVMIIFLRDGPIELPFLCCFNRLITL